MDIISIIISPNKIFLKIKEKPEWHFSFVVLCILAVIHAWLQNPFLEKLMQNNFQISPENEDQLLVFSAVFKYFLVVLAPILLIISLILSSGFTHVLIKLSGGISKFKNTFAVFVNLHIIKVIADYVTVFVIYMKGIDTIGSHIDFQVLGLNTFFDINSIGRIPYLILSQITLFELYYIALLAFGISVINNFSINKSTAISLTLWVIALAIEIGSDIAAI